MVIELIVDGGEEEEEDDDDDDEEEDDMREEEREGEDESEFIDGGVKRDEGDGVVRCWLWWMLPENATVDPDEDVTLLGDGESDEELMVERVRNE